MRQDEDNSPVSFKVNVLKLPHRGTPVVFEADPGQREALAAVHGLVSVELFRADLLVAPWKRHGVRVQGSVAAWITQECVVTLEPLASSMNEAVEGLFLPADSKLGRLGFEGGGEILLDADGPDGPETFFGDSIDVGALAEEFFGLAIDPYPRKSGVALAEAMPGEWPLLPEGPLQEKLRLLTRKS